MLNDLEQNTLKIVVKQKIEDTLDKKFSNFRCEDMNLYYNEVYRTFDIKFTGIETEDMDLSSFKKAFVETFKTCKVQDFRMEAEDNKLNIFIDFKISDKEEDQLIKGNIPNYKGEPLERFCAVEVVELWLEWAWNPKKKRYNIVGFHTFKVDEKSPKKRLLIPERILSYSVYHPHDCNPHNIFPDRRFIDLTEKNNLLHKPIYKKLDSLMGYFGLACKLKNICPEEDC